MTDKQERLAKVVDAIRVADLAPEILDAFEKMSAAVVGIPVPVIGTGLAVFTAALLAAGSSDKKLREDMLRDHLKLIGELAAALCPEETGDELHG